jgi:hypothetical protein
MSNQEEVISNLNDYLFNYDKLQKSITLEPFGDLYIPQSVIGIDVAGKGGDLCVASVLKRKSIIHWELETQETWSEPDTMHSVGKIVNILGQYKPDLAIIDVGGLGAPMYDRIKEIGVRNIFAFNGANASKIANARNTRAEGFLTLREWFDQEWLIVKSLDTIKELERIKMAKGGSDGYITIESKEKMKAEGYNSPDRADSLMMAIYGIKYYLKLASLTKSDGASSIVRKSERKQLRR